MNNSVSLQFLGAAGTVTGSKHLLRTPELNILIDCGLFQGIKSLRLRNREPLQVDPSSIDVLLITHAHLDHTGYIPLLVKNGFKGKIMLTAPTSELTRLILLDSAKIQEEDAEHANKAGYSKHQPALPLYTEDDVRECFNKFQVCNEDTVITLSDQISFRYKRNGHILGSCFIEMDCYGKKIVFSGDMGRQESALLDAPTLAESADFLVMESTYGNRIHSNENIKDELAEVISQTIQHKGSVIIPSFAVGRAQELMLILSELLEEGRIPDVPIILDSPMGASATQILYDFKDWHKLSDEQCRKIRENVKVIQGFSQTMRTIGDHQNKVVIAPSGMIAGGRVLEYLKHYLGDRKSTVLLVGYQAEGTRGRALKEGSHELKIHGKYYPVIARVRELSSLSAHADQAEMIEWIRRFITKPSKIFLVHGEPNSLEAFRVKLTDEFKSDIIVPSQGETQLLFDIQ